LTNKEKKEYLGRYKRLNEQVNQLLLEKQEILALGTKVTPTYSDMPHKSNIGDKTSTTIEKLEEHEQKINQKIDEFIAVKSDIERAIHTVQDDTLRLLMRYRYINGWTWERIAVEMHYTYQWVCQLHGKALNMIIVDSN